MLSNVWDWSRKRTPLNKDTPVTNNLRIDIYYFNSGGRSFTGCAINSFEVTVTAGDVANFTIDFFGTGSSGTGVNQLTTPHSLGATSLHKLVTWDACSFTGIGSAGGTDIQGFNFTLANNLQRGYALGNNSGFAPFAVVGGIRKLTGTVTVYASAAPGDNNAKNDYGLTVESIGTCSFNIGGAGPDNVDTPIVAVSNFNAMLKRSQAAAKTDTATYTVDFVGLDLDTILDT